MKHNSKTDAVFEQIGKNLHTIRNARKLTLHAVEIETEISHAVLSKIENGRYPAMRFETLICLAELYKVNIFDIFQSEESEKFHIYKSPSFLHDGQLQNNSNELFKAYITQQESEIAFLRSQLSRVFSEKSGF